MKLSVIIPCYNEEKTLISIVNIVKKYISFDSDTDMPIIKVSVIYPLSCLSLSLRKENCEFSSDVDETKSLWFAHFKGLANEYNNNLYDDKFKNYLNNKVQEFTCDYDVSNDCIEIHKPISELEVMNVCQKLKNGKSPDCHGLQYEHFKLGGTGLFCVLALLFNLIFRYEYMTSYLMKSLGVPIYKAIKKLNLIQLVTEESHCKVLCAKSLKCIM